mgnify:CR=1 FL=1
MAVTEKETITIEELLSNVNRQKAVKNEEKAYNYYEQLQKKYFDKPQAIMARDEYSPSKKIKIGNQLPDFSISSIDNKNITFSKNTFLGKYLLIHFWGLAEDKYIDENENIKKEKVKVLLIQIALLVGILVLWEILANAGIIQTFLFSKPSDIYKLFIKYISNGELARHVGISVYETVLGLVIGTVLGILVAIALWWSEKLSKILDPFLVVLNALPKTALAPIIIVWAGAGIQGIVVTAVTISVVVTIYEPAHNPVAVFVFCDGVVDHE